MVEMTGKLWFDTSQGTRTIDECIEAAKASYRRAFGRQADICYLNPRTRQNPPDEVDGVRIALLNNVLIYHYWIGERNGAELPAVEEDEPVEETEATDEPELIDTCPYEDCKAEQLILSPSNVCWACGKDMREAV